MAETSEQLCAPLVVVSEDSRHAQIVEQEIRFFLGESEATRLLPFPDWECLPYDRFSPHADIVSERLSTLYKLTQQKSGIISVPINTLMQRVVPIDYILEHSFSFTKGDQLNPDLLRHQLVTAGYQSASQVMTHGEYAVRGGVIDLFPMGSKKPIRLDLFDDLIESIRYFDPENQRSTTLCDQVKLLPAREIPLDDQSIRQFRQLFRRTFEGDPQGSPLYRDVSKGLASAGIEFYLPLFFSRMATLFNYLPSDSLFIHDSDLLRFSKRFYAQVEERYEVAGFDLDRPPLKPELLYLSPEQTKQSINRFSRIELIRSESEPYKRASHSIVNPLPDLEAETKSTQPYRRLVAHLATTDQPVLITAESPGRLQALEELLVQHALTTSRIEGWNEFISQPPPLSLTLSVIERGFIFNNGTLITEAQLHGEEVKQARRRQKTVDPSAVIRSLAELNPGDPVVHMEHGVGRYVGLKHLDEEPTEYIAVEYHGGDTIYVPILALDLLGRYIGGSPDSAPLHRLGSDTWGRQKRKAREKAYDVATELLEVEALRNSRRGHAFPVNQQDYSTFASTFTFEETPDQERAINEVLEDMESDSPMDRLVCGDVGFGKTEVALRAAYIAVDNSRQVAILVPTTLLAEQHFQNFRDRFADQAVEVEMLSRFRSRKEQDEIINRLELGRTDIVIGTHRLLQSDIRFKDLGLLIIDEEHRFGVRQKERIKQLRSEVDILTLTATPIPRTLNMAMSGLRDISIIATPPRERLSIKTFVRNRNTPLIQEACLREIRRGGQVYFLHNEVRTINRVAEEINKLIPEATVRVAHGQMREKKLEEIMRDFYHQHFNILICSTIIESGIDVPTANTIIIDRADRFGLAQLHQLRGRVGRSHHQAFAYLMVPELKVLTDDAAKRLDAIEQLEELGAGFTLASHDLEIRGAGELLGETQSGAIDTIGFTLFNEYLERAIRALKATPGLVRDHALRQADEKSRIEINLHLPALFPENYLPDVHTRLVMYKRIANANSEEALRELQIETIDRFGLLPEPAKNLFWISRLKMIATECGVSHLDLGTRGGKIRFESSTRIDPIVLIELIHSKPQSYSMKDATTLTIKWETNQDNHLDECWKVLEALRGIIPEGDGE